MQIILLTKGQKKTINLSSVNHKLIAVIAFGVMMMAVAGSFLLKQPNLKTVSKSEWINEEITQQRAEIERMREKTRNTLDGIALRVGQMQAQLTRLNAVGEHFAKKAKLNSSEFNFDEQAAVGGSELNEAAKSFTQNELLEDMRVLSEKLTLKEKQLELLGVFAANKKLSKEVRPAGLPVEKGWLSSFYGYRADPFTGKKSFHHGVDIAGKSGTNVLAAASGLVTWAGDKNGYGHLIEIDHGSGYVTRYGHNKKILVKVGDIVKQSDVIAKMGSTGRSTGPHVHFEVLRNNKKVNPRKYLYTAL
jgi:murein DD-endopeptidase MepM/ murein hydrolase activator NlpD